MADRLRLSRSQIAAFVGEDRDAIRVIEALLRIASETTVNDILALRQAADSNSMEFPAVRGAIDDLLERIGAIEANALGVFPFGEVSTNTGLGIEPFWEAI